MHDGKTNQNNQQQIKAGSMILLFSLFTLLEKLLFCSHIHQFFLILRFIILKYTLSSKTCTVSLVINTDNDKKKLSGFLFSTALMCSSYVFAFSQVKPDFSGQIFLVITLPS